MYTHDPAATYLDLSHEHVADQRDTRKNLHRFITLVKCAVNQLIKQFALLLITLH